MARYDRLKFMPNGHVNQNRKCTNLTQTELWKFNPQKCNFFYLLHKAQIYIHFALPQGVVLNSLSYWTLNCQKYPVYGRKTSWYSAYWIPAPQGPNFTRLRSTTYRFPDTMLSKIGNEPEMHCSYLHLCPPNIPKLWKISNMYFSVSWTSR